MKSEFESKKGALSRIIKAMDVLDKDRLEGARKRKAQPPGTELDPNAPDPDDEDEDVARLKALKQDK